jgi:hypothetical protein
MPPPGQGAHVSVDTCATDMQPMTDIYEKKKSKINRVYATALKHGQSRQNHNPPLTKSPS